MTNQIKELIENNGIKTFFVVFIHLFFMTVCNSIFFNLFYFEEQTFSTIKDNYFSQNLKCHSMGT